MMDHAPNKQTPRKLSRHDKALIAYTTGFIVSIILSVVAYGLVVNHLFTGWTMIILLAILAIAQCIVQLIFFLHLGDDSRPRWKLLTMVFMLAIFCIVVFGSLWIMNSLNYRMMMTPEQMTHYMDSQAGL